ncbi:MAG: ABC transporter ATP-binding protein [Firmicutes bacterium]|nr:ABC transporter ATP-binding protein [Bacillota bacterium]
MKNVIEMSGVSVYYDQICALDHIHLNIKEKEFLAIIGPNGGGKSTLLKVVLGLIKPDKGDVKVLGQPVRHSQSAIGYVPQFSSFDKQFPIDVTDVVLMGRLSDRIRLFHSFTKEDREIVEKVMKQLEIDGLKNRQIGQLSGGQLQRVLIARALVTNPKILMLDEPTASLDANAKTQIYAILKELNQKVTVVVVSHDMGAVSSHVNRIACLNKKLYYHGEAQLNNNVVRQVYGCPIDLIAHGIPHRVLKTHEGEVS